MSESDKVREEELVAGLRKGLESVDPAPPDVNAFAKAAFTWRDIDAELAELEFDSIDEDLPSGVRSSATARMISFQVGQWMLDIEFDDVGGRLLGAVSPETTYSVELHTAGTLFTTQSDQNGRFEAEGVSPGPLSMVLRFAEGPVVKTQWVVL